jgi:hypothetical protein
VVREALPSEYDEAGRVTSEAYREFVPDGDPAWERYLATIADVAGRADRTTILVAVDESRVVGSATLEVAGRTEADEPPLPPADEAAQEMYRKRGFERGDDRVFDDGFVLLTFAKSLT